MTDHDRDAVRRHLPDTPDTATPPHAPPPATPIPPPRRSLHVSVVRDRAAFDAAIASTARKLNALSRATRRS